MGPPLHTTAALFATFTLGTGACCKPSDRWEVVEHVDGPTFDLVGQSAGNVAIVTGQHIRAVSRSATIRLSAPPELAEKASGGVFLAATVKGEVEGTGGAKTSAWFVLEDPRGTTQGNGTAISHPFQCRTSAASGRPPRQPCEVEINAAISWPGAAAGARGHVRWTVDAQLSSFGATTPPAGAKIDVAVTRGP